MEPLTPATVREALHELAEHLARRRTHGRVYVFGAAALALAHDVETLTRDIDVAILEGHGPVLAAAQEIARSRGWPTTWINEQATAYLPQRSDRHAELVFDHPALKVIAASARHMLAMKLQAARPTDVSHVIFLMRRTGLRTVDDLEALVSEVFPDEPLGARQRRWLEDVISTGGDATQRQADLSP